MTHTLITRTTEVVLPDAVEPDGLEVRTRDLPAPAPGQVVLRMEATGVSFAEQQMRRGKYYDQPPYPFVPGYDLVGTVVAAGPGVDAGLTGRRFAAVTKTGGWATHVLVEAADLVPVPAGVSAAAAETVVVNGITAWQMLHRLAKVRSGGTIVVLGANGGVGSTLVQLARHAGIRVIGTAAQRHHHAVRELGATPSTTATRACTTGSGASRRTAWTRCSITSAVPACSSRGSCCAGAGRWCPTVRRRRRTRRAVPGCRC